MDLRTAVFVTEIHRRMGIFITDGVDDKQLLTNLLDDLRPGIELKLIQKVKGLVDLRILLFALKDPENILRVLRGEKIGTIVKE